jgi:hypothetical protein
MRGTVLAALPGADVARIGSRTRRRRGVFVPSVTERTVMFCKPICTPSGETRRPEPVDYQAASNAKAITRELTAAVRGVTLSTTTTVLEALRLKGI